MRWKASRRTTRRQRGATALEFAFVLPVFILIVYGLIVYSLIFAAQQTLTLAASEGARAALRYGSTAQREAAACQVATASVTWIASVAGAGALACAVTTPTAAECPLSFCRRVTVTYDYAAAPLTPTLPLVPVPASLRSAAIVHFPVP